MSNSCIEIVRTVEQEETLFPAGDYAVMFDIFDIMYIADRV